MGTFKDFCAELGNIEVNRIRRADDLNAETLPPDSILVGCGSKFSKFPSSALVLDNKGSARRFGLKEDIKCVTRMVAYPPSGFFDKWSLWDEKPIKPKALLERVTLVVEDASPDSTWGLLFLLARMAGCNLSEIVPAWLPAIERWEVQGMVDDPWIEWPSLASALAHSHFPGGREPTSDDYAKAWTDTLRFAAGSLALDLRPRAIKNCDDWDLWHQAYSALKQEEQAYHDWLPHALTVQLSLPMENANRRLLVDALILIEDFPTGAAKVFYRNDRINSPLKEGFTLAAHYRPEKNEKARKDITIAVDTRKGVHLRDLWKKLEDLECDKWEESNKHRPDDIPRHDLDQYLGITNQWNQPWYIDRTKTIVAAPNTIKDIGPGSLLGWEDVKDALWKVYNPLNGVEVCRPAVNPRGDSKNEESFSLLKLTPEPSHGSKNKRVGAEKKIPKRLLLADWPRDPRAGRILPPRSLGEAPVVEREIATLIERGTTEKGSIDSLTEPGTWERVKLDAGFAIVTENGVFVLDDWRPNHRIDAEKMRTAFQMANHLDQELTGLEVDEVVGRLRKRLAGKSRWLELLERKVPRLASWLKWARSKSAWKEPKGLLVDAAEVSLKLADLRAGTLSVSPNSDVRHVAEALDRRWALTSRLNLLDEQTRTIRESVKELGDARVRRIIRFVGLYGFPFYVAEGLAAHFADPIAKHWPILASGNEASPSLWWACFLMIGVLSVLLLNLLVGRDTPNIERAAEH